MADLGYYVAGVIAILAAIVKLLQARGRPHAPGPFYQGGMLLCLGLSAVVLAPTTLRLGAQVEPTPNLTRLLGNALSAGAVFCTLGMLAYAHRQAEVARRGMRSQVWLLAITVTSMAVLLVSARTSFTVDFVNVYGSHPLIVAYELVFLAYSTWGLIGILQLIHLVARDARDRFMRAGMRVLAAGAVVGLCWVLWKFSVTLFKAITSRPATLEGEVSSLLAVIAVILVALGTTMSVWGPRVAHPLKWFRTRRVYRRIEPLWSAVHEAVPEVEFQHPGAGMEFLLYHRIVEIRDSNLALRRYFHPDVPQWVRTSARDSGISNQIDVAVLVEAASLSAALEAHRAGQPLHSDRSVIDAPHELDADIDVEARWLTRVADAFVRSPIVESVRRRVRDELATTTHQ
jgi:hypothetical protein